MFLSAKSLEKVRKPAPCRRRWAAEPETNLGPSLGEVRASAVRGPIPGDWTSAGSPFYGHLSQRIFADSRRQGPRRRLRSRACMGHKGVSLRRQLISCAIPLLTQLRGDTDLQVPVAVRPTSEAVMYPYYAKCKQTLLWDVPTTEADAPKRDQIAPRPPPETEPVELGRSLGSKANHPLLRAREFLWQEGHTLVGVSPPPPPPCASSR